MFRMVALAFAKAFSKLFGLATIVFFGRAPSRDDDKAGLIGVLSLVWVVVAIAVFVPPLAETLFPFLPDDDAVIRAIAIASAVLIPPVIGFVITRMENRGGGLPSVLREAVFGYGYALVIGSLVVALVVVVPAVKITYLFRLFDLKHIAVMIEPDHFDAVQDQVQEALARHGLHTDVRDPQRLIRWIFQALVWMEGTIFRREMSRKMKLVHGGHAGDDWFELTLHATDISVIGRKEETTRVMAILAEELDEQHLYFSWDDSSQAVEDRIRAAQRALAHGEDLDPRLFTELCDELRELALSTEEWNAIRRQIYTVERDYYRAQLARDRAVS